MAEIQGPTGPARLRYPGITQGVTELSKCECTLTPADVGRAECNSGLQWHIRTGSNS